MTSVPELEAAKRKAHEIFSKADAALHKGSVTAEERDHILQHYYGTTDEREAIGAIDDAIAELRGTPRVDKSIALVAAFGFLMLSLFGVLFYATGGITGAIVLEITEVNQTYTGDAAIPLLLNGTTRINVSGLASGAGDATITLHHEGIAYTLYEYRNAASVTPHASMRRHYSAGEQVSFNATNLSSAYLDDGAQTTLLEGTTMSGLAPGQYTIKLIINDTELSQESLAFTVHAGEILVSEEFNTCGEACGVDLTGKATIDITLAGADVTLERIILTTQENNPPRLVADIPDASGIGNATVGLAGVFADADGDSLIYDSTHHDGNAETFDGETFTVSGPAGTYTYIIYASDLVDLSPSNIFSVTILAEETADTPINETPLNETPAEIPANTTGLPAVPDSTSNVTVNETNSTANETPDPCLDPNINARPETCFAGYVDDVYEEVVAPLRDRRQGVVGRFGRYGNLIIRGTLQEGSAAAPESEDFVLGYTEQDGYSEQFIATAWIDSETGDLHLRGVVHEEQPGLMPPQYGSYIVQNPNGLILAYFDERTGDLYLRGNLVQLGRVGP